jgi:transcription antitermination factor NusG
MTNWYAVYTRPRYEKKVAENLSKKRIQAYCPLISTPGQWISRRAVQNPLFKSLVFVRLTETQLDEVKTVDGVINLVYWLRKPAVIRDVEIEMIMRFLKEHASVKAERIPIDHKAIVKISQEPVEDNRTGSGADKHKLVKLLLPTLGYMLTAAEIMEEVSVIIRPEAPQHHERPLQYTT